MAANRSLLATLLQTNILGQNDAAIAATEDEYGQMWAQDVAAMFSYAAASFCPRMLVCNSVASRLRFAATTAGGTVAATADS
ncbi:hypothetical protein JHV675_51230 [Mycobacterium avium subsp. hominissuis]